MPPKATERVARGLRWTGAGLLVAGGVVVVAGIAFTRSIDALMVSAAIAVLALGLPGAAVFSFALWLDQAGEHAEVDPAPAQGDSGRGHEAFPDAFRRYAIAIIAVLAAWGARQALDVYIPGQVPFITFFLAVAIAAWAGGFAPAAFATFVSLMICAYYYVPPAGPPGAADLARLVLLGLFTLVCLGIAAILATLREALARAQELVEQMRRQDPQGPAGGDNRLRALAQSAPVALFMTDRSLACTYCNKAWLAMRGRTMTQELGHGWWEGIHGEDLPAVREARSAALAGDRPATIQYRLRLAGGEFAAVAESVAAFRDARGEVAGLVGACQARTDMALGN